MSSKKGNIIELFIDKAILAVAVLISAVILFIFVISTTKIEYRNDRYGPKEIDNVINKKALELRDKLQKDPNTANRYKSQKTQFLSQLENSIKQVNTEIKYPLPGYASKAQEDQHRIYRIPSIPPIEKATAAIAKMAAFVPTEELSPTVSYQTVETKLEDMDLVTVESAINAKQLYADFQEAFAGKGVREAWRSGQYAKPVFAKVELQRKTQQSDGSWSDWAEVPRTKICYMKKDLQVSKKAGEYEMEISLVQFAKNEYRSEILQPPVYYNAIPAASWISPSFYNERQKEITKQQDEARRLQIEADKAKKLQDKAANQPSRQPTTTRQPTTRPSGGGDTGEGGRTPGAREPVTPRTQNPRQQPAANPAANPARKPPVEKPPTGRNAPTAPAEPAQSASEESKFNAIRLMPNTNPGELDKLVFWAHDDTTVPGEKYQYRIRIGVLNPIAGKKWFAEDQNDLRNQVVLWSKFAEANDVVEIPQKLYFFASDIREIEKGGNVDKTVEVMVARYMFGNWFSHTFNVKSGEEIGKIVEATDPRLEQAGISSDTINFSTGTVMVDARKVTEWIGSGTLRSREYYEFLYSHDGKTIEKAAIKERFWSAKVAKIYKEISDALAVPPVTLLSWNQAMTNSGQQTLQRITPQESVPGAGAQPRQPQAPVRQGGGDSGE
jgi:hypothetical protein